MSKTVEVNKDRVHGVVKIATHAVAQNINSLHPLEAIIGFAEVTGRAIAAQDVSRVAHDEMLRVAYEHMRATLNASYQSRGQSTVE